MNIIPDGRVRKNTMTYGPKPARTAAHWVRDAIRLGLCTCESCCERDPRRIEIRTEKDRRVARFKASPGAKQLRREQRVEDEG